MTTEDRRDALTKLIQLREPLADASGRLRQFAWDSDTELVVLTRENIANILSRYLRGQLDESELEKWADAIESRDDVGYETTAATELRQIIFELANPELAQGLDPHKAREWMEVLKASD